jgi:GAF domain-containing protein
VIVITVYSLVQMGRLTLAVYLLITLTLFIGAATLTDGISPNAYVALIIPTVAAGLLRSWRSVLVVFLTSTALIAWSGFVNNQFPELTSQVVLYLALHANIALFLVLFSGNLQTLLEDYRRQVGNMRRVAGLSAEFGSEATEEDYVRDAINILRDDIGYSFAQLFLVENDKIQERVATALNTTQVNTYSDIELASQSAIYEAMRGNETVTVTSSDSELRRDHLLPGITAAVALPVRAGDELIGVLDVQREIGDSFPPLEMEQLKIIAGRLGNSLALTRQMRVLRSDMTDQQSIINRLTDRLRDYERAEQEVTVGAWSSYLQRRGVDLLGYDFDDGTLQQAAGVPQDIQSALQTGKISVAEDGDNQIVRVPITLRGQTLGAMAFQVPKGNQTIGPRQEELMNSVVQRLGLALENKRLFEQSQSQAQRERRANEVGGTLLSTTDIQTVLRLAADNFNEALGAVQTRIYLEPEADSESEDKR